MRWFLVLGWLLLVAGPALAERRVALVVGNGAYTQVPALVNPAHDAEDVAAALRALDFEVIERIDLNRDGMRQTLGEFADALVGADVGLFFYAGHAMQMDGVNYLVPVDSSLSREADVFVQLLNLRDVMATMSAAVETRLIFLDACRDNPLSRSLARSLPATRSTSVGNGLAPMQAPVGTLIAYSTAPDATALDGTGRNSPFTTALLEHIGKAGMEARQVLTRVRRGVIDATNGGQVPWDSSSLSGDFYFRLEGSNKPLPPVDGIVEQPAGVDRSLVGQEERLAFTEADRLDIQWMLTRLGHDVGMHDGRFGPETRRAIARWQDEAGLPVNGFLDEGAYTALLVAADPLIQARERLLDGRAFRAIGINDLLAGAPAAIEAFLALLDDLFVESSAEPKYTDYLQRLKLGEDWISVTLGWELGQSTQIPDLPFVANQLFALGVGLGIADGWAALGGQYYDGIGVPVDMANSLEFYTQAADADIADGYYGLGMHHQWGTAGLAIDIDKAIEYYLLSAERGAPWASIALGDIFNSGEQITRDVAKARFYYRQLVENPQPDWAVDAVERAQRNLAELADQ